MKRAVYVFLLLALLLAGCAPTITVYNKTQFPIHVAIYSTGGHEMLSPSPGESSYCEVSTGSYQAVAITDEHWRQYATDLRAFLNDRLKESDKMTGAQILDVVNRLKKVAADMQAYEKAAATAGAMCSGSISSEGSSAAVVTVTQGANGALQVSCGSAQ